MARWQRRRRLAGWLAGWAVVSAGAAGTASAAPHEVRVPLRDGQLSTADLLARVHLRDAAAKHLPDGTIDLRGFGSSLFVAALDAALGDGCRVAVTPDALVVHVDTDRLPADADDVKLATRTFTTLIAPEAAAAQARRYGLELPKTVDPARPLVVVVHGLDMSVGDMRAVDRRLRGEGYQTAEFDFPVDGPVADDVALLAKHLSAVHETYPGLKVDVVAFSMGGLIARGYIEGPDYAGGVDRLIMVATPNGGSDWAGLELLSKLRWAGEEMAHDPQWRSTWFITAGLGEAGRDLRPGSKLLAELNGRARRAGVRYTIVNGDQSPVGRIAADCVAAPVRWVPEFAWNWWGVRQARAGLVSAAIRLREKPATSDGPVPLASTALPGVTDAVTVHADHATICRTVNDQPPAAWPVIRDRLATP